MREASLRREVARQLEVVREGAETFVDEGELGERLTEALRAGRPLRVKLGMDPSAPDLHLGHTIVLHKLERFQALGHTPIFLIGDFTARIGDPSGRKKTRPVLGEDEVRKNAETYVAQVAKLLDVSRAEVRFNGEWMDRMSPADFVRLCSHYTVARILEREDFSRRYGAGEPIAVHELLYPLVQAYDSVALRADVELGGTDQTFNLLLGREIQRAYGQLPQTVITHPLLVGTDGREKMSKSLGNTIGITDAPEEIYGKLMSVSDALMLDYLELLFAGEWEDLREAREAVRAGRGDPLALKHELALRVVARFHGDEAARQAREGFRRVIQRRELPEEIPEFELPEGQGGGLGLLDLLRQVDFAASNSEARRLVAQGSVQVDGERVGDPHLRLGPGSHLVQVGRRRFARVRVR
jgi:tyrosyl-tRNA synthetase